MTGTLTTKNYLSAIFNRSRMVLTALTVQLFNWRCFIYFNFLRHFYIESDNTKLSKLVKKISKVRTWIIVHLIISDHTFANSFNAIGSQFKTYWTSAKFGYCCEVPGYHLRCHVLAQHTPFHDSAVYTNLSILQQYKMWYFQSQGEP